MCLSKTPALRSLVRTLQNLSQRTALLWARHRFTGFQYCIRRSLTWSLNLWFALSREVRGKRFCRVRTIGHRASVNLRTLIVKGLFAAVVTTGIIILTDVPSRISSPKENRKVPATSVMRTEVHAGADVLILSYKRSGSSFLGRILGWRNDSFYWFEPLWKPHPVSYFRDDGRICDYTTPRCDENRTFANSSLNSALGFMKDYYLCSFKGHHRFVQEWAYNNYEYSGPDWTVFRQCRKDNNTVAKCLSDIESLCRAATHRVAKVLRFDVMYSNNLLQTFPRLKVVFLLRDPRGILNSHLHTRWLPKSLQLLEKFEGDAKAVCSRMERDLKAATLLIKQFTDRVKIVQYENLEGNPENAKLLYKFLGMSKLDRWLMEAYKFNTTNKDIFDPFSYRKELSWNAIQIIDKHCSNLYSKLGLVKFKDLKHLWNLTLPSIIGKLPYALP